MRSRGTARPLLALALTAALVAVASSTGAQVRQSPPRATEAEVEILERGWEADPLDPDAVLAYTRALASLETISGRRRAVEILRETLLKQPQEILLRIALADLYYRQGFLTLARQQLEEALEHAPDTGPAYARLGRLAFRDWLKFQRRDALDLAEALWKEAARRAPNDTEPWLGLGILALLDDRPEHAEVFARRCLQAAARRRVAAGGEPERTGIFLRGSPGATPERALYAPDPRGEGLLMLGAAAYEQGKLGVADSAFSHGLAYVSPPARAHLLDITPAASDGDTLALGAIRFDSGTRAEFLRRFWRSRDPDLTTSWNEVQLEFLSRGTLAYFLFFDQRRQRWDERGYYLVRYGKPEKVEYNPPSLGVNPFTTNRLMWRYPSLGMNVFLEDRYLNEFYDVPIHLYYEVDMKPDPDVLAEAEARGLVAVAGRGVFRARKPGTLPLPGEARTALFRRVRGFDPVGGIPAGRVAGRVELYLAVTGSLASDGVTAEAVVLDSSWNEVARGRSTRAAWCYADTVQVLQFNFELPAGEYVLGVSARDPAELAYGSWKLPFEVTPPSAGRLELSDVELACEFQPDTLGGAFDKPTYAIIPNPLHRVARDRPLGIYFEIYGLVPDETGYSEVRVEYTVRSTKKDRRPFFVKLVNPRRNEPRIQAERTDETPGRVRFQYVSTSLENPEPGPYELVVRVTDERTGRSAERKIDFEVIP